MQSICNRTKQIAELPPQNQNPKAVHAAWHHYKSCRAYRSMLRWLDNDTCKRLRLAPSPNRRWSLQFSLSIALRWRHMSLTWCVHLLYFSGSNDGWCRRITPANGSAVLKTNNKRLTLTDAFFIRLNWWMIRISC